MSVYTNIKCGECGKYSTDVCYVYNTKDGKIYCDECHLINRLKESRERIFERIYAQPATAVDEMADFPVIEDLTYDAKEVTKFSQKHLFYCKNNIYGKHGMKVKK